MTATTTDPLESPLTVAALAQFIGVDDTDPILPSLLLSATDAVIQFLGRDLLARDWRMVLWDWPIVGTPSIPSMSRQDFRYVRDINLPFANLISVATVELYGVNTTDFGVRGDAVRIKFPPVQAESDEPAIAIDYRAGYGEAPSDVPDPVIYGIKTLAAFMFEHRGDCDAQQAIQRSGAAAILQPWVKPTNLVAVG